MRKCAVWSKASEAEFANADEAMEKLIMNRLYAYTFAPAVKKEGKRSVQTDDLERDRVLSQRAEMFSWVKEEHLDVPKGDHSKGFLEFAMQGERKRSSKLRFLSFRLSWLIYILLVFFSFFFPELIKINNYKAPRDKLICILNSCKVIFGEFEVDSQSLASILKSCH